ncbi:MAG: hypothetical protein AB8B50_07130 [Pirellulaceae bacterium]
MIEHLKARSRHKRLHTAVLAAIAEHPSVAAIHDSKRWTRRMAHLGTWIINGLTVFGLFLLVGTCVLLGMMMNGPRSIGLYFGGGVRPVIYLPTVLACVCVTSVLIVLIMVFRLRQSPITARYQPWAATLPIPDSRLISPVLGGFLATQALYGLFCLGAFFPVFWFNDLDLSTAFGLVAFTALTATFAWLLAEFFCRIIPPTPLVNSVLVTVAILVFLTAIGLGVTPRSVIEIRYAGSFAPIWALPPGGWFVGVTGLDGLPASNGQFLPLLALVLMIAIGLQIRSSFQLEDIQLTSGIRHNAFRVGWVRQWERPRSDGDFAPFIDDLQAARQLFTERRKRLLGEGTRPWLARLLIPWELSPKQISALGLVGIRYPRRSELFEFTWGFWPVIMAIGLYITNQYMPLVGLPRFIRLPMLLATAISLVDFRVFEGAANEGSANTTSQAQFPITIGEIFWALVKNRIIFLWSLLPLWLLAAGILLLTDTPRQMIIHPPLIAAALSMTFPVVAIVGVANSHMRSNWSTWLLLVWPWCVVGFSAMLMVQFGVVGYLLALRPDLAWMWLGITTAIVMLGAGVFFLLAKRFAPDRSTSPLANSMKMQI